MTLRTWTRRLFARTPRTSRKEPARFRPRLEALEGRLAPATLTVNSMADTANATDTYLSLREAIALVNSATLPSGLSTQITAKISGTLHDGKTDTIQFDPTKVTGPITLGGTDLGLSLPSTTATITIDGGAAGVTVDGNHASGIFWVHFNVSATLNDLTISNGSAEVGSGIENSGTLTVSNCTLSGNSATYAGGGIDNNGTATVSNCTLSGNSATYHGGGIFNENIGRLTVSNSTLSGNSTTSHGGGIDNNGTATVSNCTLSGNSAVNGGGIRNFGMLALNNTIVANGPSGGDVSNVYEGTITGSDNLIQDGLIQDGSGGLADTITGDPKLDPNGLQNNGGPTQTIALQTGSPAIGGVPANTPGTPSTDQRGFSRNTAAATDIGAFEVQDFSISVSPSSLTLPPGFSGEATITTAVTAGSAQPVVLSLTVPAGVTASLSLGSVTAGTPSILSLTATPSAAAGPFPVTITGTAASGSHTTTLFLMILQQAQTINFAPLANQVYGVAPFSLGATASSGLPVSYTVSGPAALSGNTLTVTGAGVVDVTASQGGNATFSAAPPVQQSFTVSPAPLTITANDPAPMIQGEAFPAFTVSYSGFVLGQDASVLSGTLAFSLTATGSNTYAITPSGLTASNYAITFASGTLTVLSHGQATSTLQAQVDAAGLPHGMQNSLDSQLQAAAASFSAGNTTAGVNQLKAFIHHVSDESGDQIDAALADALIKYAQRIISAVG
jgi:hypothetical protein